MTTEYQQQRWQLHTRLEQVKDIVEQLEQQLKAIDGDLLRLDEPNADDAKPALSAQLIHNENAPGEHFPLPIAAG